MGVGKIAEAAIRLDINFPFKIEPDKECGGYNAACPKLNIFTQGETFAEAKENLVDAIQLHLEAMIQIGKLDEMMERLQIPEIKPGNVSVKIPDGATKVTT